MNDTNEKFEINKIARQNRREVTENATYRSSLLTRALQVARLSDVKIVPSPDAMRQHHDPVQVTAERSDAFYPSQQPGPVATRPAEYGAQVAVRQAEPAVIAAAPAMAEAAAPTQPAYAAYIDPNKTFLKPETNVDALTNAVYAIHDDNEASKLNNGNPLFAQQTAPYLPTNAAQGDYTRGA